MIKIFFLLFSIFYLFSISLTLALDFSGDLSFESDAYYVGTEEKQNSNSSKSTGHHLNLNLRGQHDFNLKVPLTFHHETLLSFDYYKKTQLRFNIDDLFLQYRNDKTDLRFGYQILRWSLFEGFRPLGNLSPRDYSYDLLSLDYMGQPSLQATIELSRNLSLGGFFRPYYTFPRYPGENSRFDLSSKLLKGVVVERDGNISHDQWGREGGIITQIRSETFDFGLNFSHLVDTENPLLGIDLKALKARPHYFKINQWGGNIQKQFTVPVDFIGRFELVYKDYNNEYPVRTLNDIPKNIFNFNQYTFSRAVDHFVFSLGFEKSFSLPFGSELLFLLEGQSVLWKNKKIRSELNTFQRDVLLSARYFLNDLMGTEFIVTLISDLERQRENWLNLEYKRRLTDAWKIAVMARYIDAPKKEEDRKIPRGLTPFHHAHEASIRLQRFF